MNDFEKYLSKEVLLEKLAGEKQSEQTPSDEAGFLESSSVKETSMNTLEKYSAKRKLAAELKVKLGGGGLAALKRLRDALKSEKAWGGGGDAGVIASLQKRIKSLAAKLDARSVRRNPPKKVKARTTWRVSDPKSGPTLPPASSAKKAPRRIQGVFTSKKAPRQVAGRSRSRTENIRRAMATHSGTWRTPTGVGRA